MKIKKLLELQFCLFFLFVPMLIFAQETLDEGFFDEGPDPPPTAPINEYVVFLILIAVLYAAYKYYKSDNLPLKRNRKTNNIKSINP